MLVETLSKSERAKAEALLKRVDALLDKTRQTQEALHKNFIEIGVVLTEVEASRAWILTDCKTFDQYMKSCETRFGRGRTSLYAYKGTAVHLLPSMSKEELIEIGISRAHELAQYVKRKNCPPTHELISKAKDSKIGVDEFRAAVSEELHEKPEAAGKWRSFGFFADDAEWKEIQRAFGYARIVDEIPDTLPDWQVEKRCIQAMVKEVISSWEHDVLKAGA